MLVNYKKYIENAISAGFCDGKCFFVGQKSFLFLAVGGQNLITINNNTLYVSPVKMKGQIDVDNVQKYHFDDIEKITASGNGIVGSIKLVIELKNGKKLKYVSRYSDDIKEGKKISASFDEYKNTK